jgi:hypothetical protein
MLVHSRKHVVLHEAERIAARKDEGDTVPAQQRFADLRAEVYALPSLHPTCEKDHRHVRRQAEVRAGVDL